MYCHSITGKGAHELDVGQLGSVDRLAA